MGEPKSSVCFDMVESARLRAVRERIWPGCCSSRWRWREAYHDMLNAMQMRIATAPVPMATRVTEW